MICLVNQKGGVGKTASVVNIGAALIKLGQRVLLIDLDPQESLSYWLGITQPEWTIYDFFEGRKTLRACKTRHISGMDVVASDEMLATVTPDIEQLRQALAGESYDFVLMDCSPTLGMTTLAALTAADWVMIPVCPDLLSIKGMTQLLGTIDTVREETNASLRLRGIIATRCSMTKKMHRNVLEQLDDYFKDVPIFTVRESIAVSESPVAGQSVLDYRPKSGVALDYLSIARDLLNG
ncbi:MAG: ParA family protein [Negativicutes bacterium]|nr:ParA family protein [Negativicutes bacterium]